MAGTGAGQAFSQVRARETVPPRRSQDPPTDASRADRIQAILASKGLTLYQVSRHSAARYGRSSPFFVPHNLYYDLRSKTFSPSIHQIHTLSLVSGYRIQDWLQVFGFDLEDIPRLQLQLPSRRTILLDSSLTDRNGWVSWFCSRVADMPVPPIAPLVQLLEFASPRRIGSLAEPHSGFLYARVGREDALAFPDVSPGSIVRIDRAVRPHPAQQDNATISDRFFLIEHCRGFFCCRIRLLAKNVIVPIDSGFSFAQVELHVPEEARIWGAVDFEFRPLLDIEEPVFPRDLTRRWLPQPLLQEPSFGQMLRGTRRRLHISTREAARMSHTIAELLNDVRYRSSSSSLSDYELQNVPPRDFHKLVTLCSIYGLPFASAMREIGIDVGNTGTEPMPDRFVFRIDLAGEPRNSSKTRPGVLEMLVDQFQNEVPFFLRDRLDYFSGGKHVSINDFFWIGGNDDPLHPYLANGLVAILNRRRKTPIYFHSKPMWQQPIYVILGRDGRYLAASCGVENNKLILHPYGPDFHASTEYRYHRDAEVVGQIIAIARRFR